MNTVTVCWDHQWQIKKFYGLKSEEQGDDIYLRRYEHFPEYYRAANIEQGLWTAPYFDCDGLVT